VCVFVWVSVYVYVRVYSVLCLLLVFVVLVICQAAKPTPRPILCLAVLLSYACVIMHRYTLETSYVYIHILKYLL